MKYDSVLDAIGNTPLIKLSHISPENGAVIYGKFEGVNIGGSIKTRTAYEMICKAEADGILKKDMTIVEATSGNQGVGLALVGAIRGYKVLIIMPDSVSEERRKIITQYGATVELVHDNDNIGECIARCKELAEEYAKKGGYYLPAQFENPANVEAQKKTGEEIVRDLERVDGFCAGVGTGGTLTGIGTVLREHNPDIEIWAVEPDRAAVLSGSTNIESHLQMGIGDGIIPAILDQNVYDRLCMINDDEAIAVSKMLALKEGILAGISSGTNVAAALKMAQKLGKGKIVVTVLPDTGERYYSTPLFE
ncbi:MAG: cysteine synthase family protein [Erysipelotrichaceae bacterium]|nr:cysteine synthase family protein [Erysipelotrichaceae bacterium]